MMSARDLTVVVLLLLFIIRGSASDTIYHNQFALLIPKGKDTADKLAEQHGFSNLGQIGTLDNYFLFENARLQKRSGEQVSFILHNLRKWG